MNIRKPAVAGTFYPADPVELSQLVDSCYRHPLGPGAVHPAEPGTADIVAVVAPHAGYEYSGPVAAFSYLHASSLPDPSLIVIVAPNHYGVGSGVSSWKKGEWETPLGKMTVDSGAAERIASECDLVAFDPESHRLEHSLEVQLPFLQKLYGSKVPFVPISLAFQDIETTSAVAKGVAAVLKGRRALLIASSDLTHYEPAETARRKDSSLLACVEAMDVEGFYDTLDRLQVTACGYGAISTVMRAARALGKTKGELLKYANSGDTTGDYSQVVGYGSLRFL